MVDGNVWGSETKTKYALVQALTQKVPGIAILAGGGVDSKNEVLCAVRQNLPLLVIEGSGGLADEIVALKQSEKPPDDPTLAEIILDAKICLHRSSNSVKGMERLILRELGRDYVLVQAWEAFADYDFNASLQQKRFNRLRQAILILGVAGTALAISKQVYAPGDINNLSLAGLYSIKSRSFSLFC